MREVRHTYRCEERHQDFTAVLTVEEDVPQELVERVLEVGLRARVCPVTGQSFTRQHLIKTEEHRLP